jgi:L-alanine-DL-glutamate epimerase-like enolase superfamily enzyme
LKITKVEAIPVSIPLKQPFVLSKKLMDWGEYVIVRIHTDEGIVRIGESSPLLPITGDCQESIVPLIQKHLAPLIVGESVFNIERIWEKMDWAVPRNSAAKSGIDIALYDAIDKRLGQIMVPERFL